MHVEFAQKYENFLELDETEKVLKDELQKFRMNYKLKLEETE